MFHDTSTSDRLSLSSGSNVFVCCTVRVVVRVRVIVRERDIFELVSSAVRFEIFYNGSVGVGENRDDDKSGCQQ